MFVIQPKGSGEDQRSDQEDGGNRASFGSLARENLHSSESKISTTAIGEITDIRYIP